MFNDQVCAQIKEEELVLVAGVSPLPGAVLVLHSLPLEFPLAIAFAEQLLTWKLEESSERSEDELDTVPPSVLLQVVELLGGFNSTETSVLSSSCFSDTIPD